MRRIEVLSRHLVPLPQGDNITTVETAAHQDDPVVIVSYCRTPIGSFQGSLSSLPAPKLGAVAIKEAVKRAGITPAQVDEVYYGNVVSANVGQAPARQSALGAGLPDKTICTTVNKVCASGMKAVVLAAQDIILDQASIVVAGGAESMSNAPYYLPKARGGYRMGNGEVVDGLIKDGLWDPYNDHHMGICGEKCATKYNVSRKEQDEYAASSYAKAVAAYKAGAFTKEIVPVEVPGVRGQPAKIVAEDDEYKNGNIEKISKLRPAFDPKGTVTAGNSSPVSDGAAALVLMKESKAKQLGLPVLARIRSYADAEQEPVLFTTTPALAIPKALSRIGLTVKDVDYFEINEAFSVVAIVNRQLLGIDPSKLNVNGGAVGLGHPIGCSGARIICTLLSVLQQKNAKIGCAAICNGGGGATAIVIERV